jgi:hypothetical protein
MRASKARTGPSANNIPFVDCSEAQMRDVDGCGMVIPSLFLGVAFFMVVSPATAIAHRVKRKARCAVEQQHLDVDFSHHADLSAIAWRVRRA